MLLPFGWITDAPPGVGVEQDYEGVGACWFHHLDEADGTYVSIASGDRLWPQAEDDLPLGVARERGKSFLVLASAA